MRSDKSLRSKLESRFVDQRSMQDRGVDAAKRISSMIHTRATYPCMHMYVRAALSEEKWMEGRIPYYNS